MGTGGRKTRYSKLSLRRPVLREGALQREPEMGARTFRQKLERGTVRVGQLARDIEAEAGSAGSGGEKRLEQTCSRVGRYARPVVVQFADDGVAHVAGTCGDRDAAL